MQVGHVPWVGPQQGYHLKAYNKRLSQNMKAQIIQAS